MYIGTLCKFLIKRNDEMVICGKTQSRKIIYDEHKEVVQIVYKNIIVYYYEGSNKIKRIKITVNTFVEKDISMYYTGQLSKYSVYLKDLPHSDYIELYENGKIQRMFIYNNGKREGRYVRFYNNGSLSIERNYVNNKLDGESIVYYQNGSKKSITNYSNGQKHGEETWYDKTGRKISKRNYLCNVLHGPYGKYLSDGTFNKCGRYHYGKIITHVLY
jgi:hypothetical protein